MADGFFKCKQGFTVVQNIISRDRNISMKAKGLYLIIQSYITMPDRRWLKSDFMKMVPEGQKAFDSAWNELKDKSYLKIHIHMNGNKFEREYELLDEPQYGPHTFYYNSSGEVTKSVGEVEGKDEEMPESTENTEELRHTQKGHVVKGSVVKGNVVSGNVVSGQVVNGDVNNKSFIYKDLDNKALYNNPSFIQEREPEQTPVPEGRNEVHNEIILDIDDRVSDDDAYMVMDEIDANNGIPHDYAFDVDKMIIAIKCLCSWNNHEGMISNDKFDKAAYKLVVEDLIEMTTTTDLMNLKGCKVSCNNVIDRISEIYLNSEFGTDGMAKYINCVIRRFKAGSVNTAVKNPRTYLKTIIWESFSLYKMEWETFFQHSFYGNMGGNG